MAQWSLKERLQPSLLDRLTDERPEKTKESSTDQVLSQDDLRRAVIRDLSSLFNSVALEVAEDLDRYPDVKDSVLNYGMPDLSGRTSSSVDLGGIESAVKAAIRTFEPRIIRHSLNVTVKTDLESMSHNSLLFEIEGAIFGQPAPFQVVLHSELDLENGEVRVREN